MARPKKMAKRTAKGRISRAAAANFDRGTEQAQARKARFHGNGYDAIGRAYEAGLLGMDGARPSARAKALMDMARSVNRAYWCEYEVGATGCTLGRGGATTCHMGPPIRGLDDPRQEEWLVRMLALVPARERALFDALVIDMQPDAGPVWLDRMIAARAAGVDARADDVARLQAAGLRLEMMLG